MIAWQSGIFAVCTGLLACSNSNGGTVDGKGGASGSGGSSNAAGMSSTSGGVGTPSSGGSSSGGAVSSGGASSGGASNSGGTTSGSGGGPASGGRAGNGGAQSGGASSGGASGNAGSGGARGGAPGQGGAGGASAGGGAIGSGGSSGGPAGGSSGDITCPAGATFCSGFEGAALPSEGQFLSVGPSSANAYTLDTSQHFAGKQSLQITKGSGGFYYRALAVPVPGQNFWVRMYLRVSSTFGDNSHDSLFGASTGTATQDSNNETLVEFSEQFNKVLLNTKDQLFQPTDTNTISADMWHCIEAHYDSSSGDVQIFSDGKEIVHATGYAKQTFKTFRIGYMQYNDARSIWYDDVIVAPSRVACQ